MSSFNPCTVVVQHDGCVFYRTLRHHFVNTSVQELFDINFGSTSNQLANEVVIPVYSSCATRCLCIYQTLRHRFVNTSVNHVANGLVKPGFTNSVRDIATLMSACCLLCRCLILCFVA